MNWFEFLENIVFKHLLKKVCIMLDDFRAPWAPLTRPFWVRDFRTAPKRSSSMLIGPRVTWPGGFALVCRGSEERRLWGSERQHQNANFLQEMLENDTFQNFKWRDTSLKHSLNSGQDPHKVFFQWMFVIWPQLSHNSENCRFLRHGQANVANLGMCTRPLLCSRMCETFHLYQMFLGRWRGVDTYKFYRVICLAVSAGAV